MRFRKVYLEITDLCNRNCSFCPGTRREQGMMDEQSFRLFAGKLCGWTEYLYFHLMGEPLLHPKLPVFLQIARELGFRVILTTNGTLLPETQDVLLSAPALHKVNISLHSFEGNAGGDPAQYLSGCTDFARQAAARGIVVSFRLWNADGAHTKGLHTRNPELLSYLHHAFPEPWQENPRGSRLAERVYLNCAEAFDWPSYDAPEQGENVFCYGLKDHIGVLWDGTVVPCCLDGDGCLPLGDLRTQTVEEILNSPRAVAMAEGFRQRKAVEELCRRCGYARRFDKGTPKIDISFPRL